MLDVSRSHTMTPHLSTSEQLVAKRYLPNNTHYYRQTFMLLARFEPTISAHERPQTYILDRTQTMGLTKNKYTKLDDC